MMQGKISSCFGHKTSVVFGVVVSVVVVVVH